MVCNGSSGGVTGSARATLASWAKVLKRLQSLQLQFKAYQRLNLNKKEKRPLCIGREGRAWLRSSTSVHTHTHTHTQSHSSGKLILRHQNTNIKGHTDNHIKKHSESHKSADTQIYKKQTSSNAHIKKSPNTQTHTHTHTRHEPCVPGWPAVGGHTDMTVLLSGRH